MKPQRQREFRNAFAIATCLAPLAVLAQQTPLQDFRQIDYFWAQTPEVFQSLWQTARTRTLRIAILGDSQETSPTSEGAQYIARLNFEMWRRFGNVPETPVEGCSDYGGGSPPADWLMRGICATPGPVPTRLAAYQVLPNVFPAAFSTSNSQTNVTQGKYGQLTMLQQDAIDVDAGAAIPASNDYFNTDGVVKARIFAATNASSGEVAYMALPTASHVPSYSAGVTTVGTLTQGLESTTFDIKAGDTQPLAFNNNRYMALEVFGSDDRKLTDIVGLRFFNETHPEGVIFDTFSHGGYTATKFLGSTGGAGAMFRAFGFQAAVVHYGANEGGGVTAEQFGANIAAVITRVRSWVGDPNFPVILIADVYEQGLTAAQTSEYDKYVGAELAIAQTDANVMVVNARRLMEDIGWNGSSGEGSQFLKPDGVHYSALGAQMLAAAEAAAMMGEIRVAGCLSDPNGVTLESSATLTVEIGGATACTGYGQYANAQTLTLNQPSLQVVLTNGFAPSPGQRFKILSWGKLSGTFKDLNLPSLTTGLRWDTGALYTTGTITAIPSTAPAISFTSGANQSVTLPASPVPLAFTLSGTGTLTVTAQSSNPALLPNSAISIGSGCGSTTTACTATLALAKGQTGSSTLSFTVADDYGQSSTGTTTIRVNPAPDSGSGTGGSGGSGSGGSGTGSVSTTGSSGGGGTIDFLTLFGLVGVGLCNRPRARGCTNSKTCQTLASSLTRGLTQRRRGFRK